MKNILVFNVGASSIKYSLFKNLKKIEEGKYERLKNRADYKRAFIDLLKILKNKKIDLIIHRVVHGGNFKKPIKINPHVKKEIKKYCPLAPLHNPIELMIINLAEKLKKPQYAVFDTSFFTNLKDYVKIYPLDSKITKRYNLKKYGFHGISHKSVSQKLKGKTITCHIGDGVSITAIRDNKPIDTSMGFTPLEGVMMGTRSGDIDPGLIIFLAKKRINISQLLNKESGLKGISGYSDFRDVMRNIKQKKSKLAYKMFVYRITKQIGAYITTLNGLDNLVFTGAIGANHAGIRKDITKNLKFLGKINILNIPANEDLQMVREVLRK